MACAACGRHLVAPRTALEPLRVGTSGDYPPFSVRDPDGGGRGFDVEVARAYAAARGRRLELVPFRWPELAARLAAGDFDVAMSGVTVRGDRLVVGTMTAAVARADAVLLMRPPGTATGLDRRDRRIAVNRGGHLERVARARFPHATIVAVDDNRSLPEPLARREVDAVVTDSLEAATFDPGAFVVVARLSRDRKAYWVAPGREALAADLDAWLLERERDGTLPRLRALHLRVEDPPSLEPELARLVDLAARRLLVMPLVAAAKRAAGLPIVDAAREATVVEGAVARAAAAGVDPEAARRLVRAEIAAARAVQIAAPPSGPSAAADGPTLATLRIAIDALDAALLRALARAAGTTRSVDPAAVAAALRNDAELPGFDGTHADAIAAAIVAIVRAPAPARAAAIAR